MVAMPASLFCQAPPNYDEYAKVVVDEKIPCVETAGHFKGLAPFVERFKAAGQ